MQFEIKGLKDLKDALDPKRYKKIATRVLNKLGSQGKTAISREVRNTYNIKRERLDSGFYMRRATWENLEVLIRYKGRTPGLQHFDARRTNSGVTVKVRKASGRKVVKGAFMANTPEGALAVWKPTGYGKRLMTKGRYKGKMREPIKRLHGPDVPGMVNTVGIEAAQQVIDEKAEKILAHEFEYELGKGR